MLSTENTHLKNVTPEIGESSPSVESGIMPGNTYQRPVLIVAGSLLTLLVWIAMAGKSAGPHFQSSAHEMADGAVAVADYQVDSTNLALTKDIFGVAVSGNEEGLKCDDRCPDRFCKCFPCLICNNDCCRY